MNEKQRRSKNPTNNINIHINLKLDSKNAQLSGKKIANNKEITKNIQDSHAGQANGLKRKIPSLHDLHKHQKSIQEFTEEKVKKYNNEDEENINAGNVAQKKTNPFKKQSKKRNKSRSLQNLKIKYYQKSPEDVNKSGSKSKSKSHSKSKSRSKSKKQQKRQTSPKSFILSRKQNSKSKSKSKSKSRSKSPITLKSKTNIIKHKESPSYRQSKSKDKRESYGLKKTHSVQLNDKKSKQSSVQPSKKTSQTIKAKVKVIKQKLQKQKTPKKISKKQQNPKKPKTIKKSQFIYHQSYLDKMATRIQSVWRGYLIRRKLKQQLHQISNKIKTIKQKKWEEQSNNSIIQVSNSSYTARTFKQKSQRQGNQTITPQFMIQIEKLRKKLEQQENKFKILANQNDQLKQNFIKISNRQSKQKHQQKKLNMKNQVVSLRIQSEQSQPQQRSAERSKKKLEHLLNLPVVIKTQQSNPSFDYNQLKKKTQSYECSPKHNESSFKFNKSIIKKLFLQKQQKINEKYNKKNESYKDKMLHQLLSPKTYIAKCSQLENFFHKQKEQMLNKYKEAQRALLLVAELQQNDTTFIEQPLKQNKNTQLNKNSYLENSNQKSPKNPNLFINVDQIQSQGKLYHPIITNNSHRVNKQQEDLSELYNKVMEECQQEKAKENVYLVEQTNFNIQNYQQNNKVPAQKVQEVSGFQTNLLYIQNFYIKFCQFFREIPSIKTQILTNLSQQITFDPQIYLKFFKQQEDLQNKYTFPYFKLISSYNVVVPIYVFNTYENQLSNDESPLFQSKIEKIHQKHQEQFNLYGYSSYQLKQYHDMSLYDAFNQSLNYQRPGGIQGSNLDFLTSSFFNINRRKVSRRVIGQVEQRSKENNIDIILGNAIHRVINSWACSLCGFINDEENEEEKLDEAKLKQIREIRLTLILQQILSEEENSLKNNPGFYLREKLEIADLITYDLMNEVSKEIIRVMMKRQLKEL